MFNLKNVIMDLPVEEMAFLKPPPVRVMDPVWLGKFLSDKELNRTKIRQVTTAVSKYNKTCYDAAIKLNEILFNALGY